MQFSDVAGTVLTLIATVSFGLAVPLSLGEGAVSRLSVASAEDLAEEGAKHARKISQLAENRRLVLASLRACRTFVTTAAVGCGACLLYTSPSPRDS